MNAWLGSRWRASFAILIASTGVAYSAPLDLAGDGWTISIDPATLAASAHVRGENEPVAISTQSFDTAAVADVVQDHDENNLPRLRWRLPARGLAVSATLDKQSLDLAIVADAPTTFTWPNVRGDGDVKSLIVPLFEGLCVPTDDAPWATFLGDQGPFNTIGDLSMPFFATMGERHTVTYTLENPFNNDLTFAAVDGRLGMSVTHACPVRKPVETYAVRVTLGDPSPIAPAKLYRQSLIDAGQFVTLKQKIAKSPDVAKLIGAAHVYLWSDGALCVEDVRDFVRFRDEVNEGRHTVDKTPAGRLLTLLPGDDRSRFSMEKISFSDEARSYVDNYDKRRMVAALNVVLGNRDFCKPGPWDALTIPDALRQEIAAGVAPARVRLVNEKLLEASFPNFINRRDTWGNGTSTRMLDAFAAAKLDRLWLGSPSWAGLADHPQFVARAIEQGYLVAPYDSYHSIHAPGQLGSWETAQFDQNLYDTGGVILADGKNKRGFKQLGEILSPRAARPALEARVNRLADQFKCNSWFIDCDATGECFDDYSPAHPSTQREDIRERIDRLAWIRNAHHMVIGSEGGAAYAAPIIAFAHGEMTPCIAWGDEQMYKDKTSPFYLGGYYPPEAPAAFFKRVPMKPELARVYADPHFRVPLYETVFHDSVIATHQWGYGSLKFDDPNGTRALLELLYNVPPLYHLNLDAWKTDGPAIRRQYQFFSPLHRIAATLPMTSFEWVTSDRLVQRTRFGDRLTLTANFGSEAYTDAVGTIPPRAIRSDDAATKQVQVYEPIQSP